MFLQPHFFPLLSFTPSFHGVLINLNLQTESQRRRGGEGGALCAMPIPHEASSVGVSTDPQKLSLWWVTKSSCALEFISYPGAIPLLSEDSC